MGMGLSPPPGLVPEFSLPSSSLECIQHTETQLSLTTPIRHHLVCVCVCVCVWGGGGGGGGGVRE